MTNLILHGTWSTGALFVWGESTNPIPLHKGRQPRVPFHPNAAPPEQLRAALAELAPSGEWADIPVETRVALLPSNGQGPDLPPWFAPEAEKDRSALHLAPWKVPGLPLPVLAALDLLVALPTGGGDRRVGVDLRFWSLAAKFGLELLARHRYLPGLVAEEGSYRAAWLPALDDPQDRARRRLLIEGMPPACRALFTGNREPVSTEAAAPEALLDGFVRQVVDRAARDWGRARKDSQVKAPSSAAGAWWNALWSEDGAITLPPSQREQLPSLFDAWKEWAGQLRAAETAAFRLCFRLEPPEIGKKGKAAASWTLRYMLQANDDPSLLIPAEQVWQARGGELKYLERRFAQPQERLLASLGLAARLFPPIMDSLHTAKPESASLTVDQAYAFLREVGPLLEGSGFGVLVPPWWNKPGARLGLRAKLQTEGSAPAGQGILGMDTLVQFNWELALGDEPLSREEFERLAALKSPLVQVRGQWVMLQPEQVEAAIAFWEKKRRQKELTLGEAIEMALGGMPEVAGLPVQGVETTGWLSELLGQLRSGSQLEELPQPAGFVGELRPYQVRGYSWLEFLGKWGLGACLADDMGLGKCARYDTLISINGMIKRAEEIWNAFAGEALSDGEGYWTTPTQPLLVNSLDEQTGRIVLVPVRRLYRQHVHETMRKVTLEDGSSITITRPHRLLASKGWTNELHVGDYICVPARTVWEGQAEDPELVKFLAWQIAEGYELADTGRLSVTQKDKSQLEDLRESLLRIGQRYNIRANNPSIRHWQGKTPSLQVCSRDYRRFLEAKGYLWGKRSREKEIPPFIMQSSLDTVRLFLRHYFDAEASVVHRMRSIEISTASPILIQQLSLLLRRFGIWLRVSAKQKRATNGSGIYRTYYIGLLGGNSVRLFLREIGFGREDKQRKLEEVCAHECNTNVEGIPASELVAQSVATTGLPIRHFGMHNTVYLDGSQQFSRTSLQRGLTGFDRILSGEAEQEYRQLKGSKWTKQTLGAYAHLDMEQLDTTRQQLQWLLDQEVFYCRIKSIEDVDYDGWVYDLEVEGHHNFVAENILCHNTIQAISMLLHEREQASVPPALLLCPTSVVGNWEREVHRFAPSLRVLVHHGSGRASGEDLLAAVQEADLVVSTYGLVRRDVDDLARVRWSAVILDEAQNVKNPQAKQTQAVRRLKAPRRIALTGTPVENRLSELWSIMNLLNPGLLGSQASFRKEYALPIERYGDEDVTRRLKSMVSPFVLRRLKTDPNIIQDLPEKLEMKVYCSLTPEQATLYQAVVQESLRQIEEAEGMKRRGVVLSTLLRLKQVCNHPAHLLGDGSALPGRSGKLDRLSEMLEEALSVGDRALVFTQFAEMGHMLHAYLQEQFHTEVLFLHGGTPQKQRVRMVDRFQQPEGGPPILLLSLKAGGTGLNLTAANHVFHFDRWWNPAVENQATDRAFRIGQTRNVQVHKLICAGTLEERIDELIESKKALAESIVGGGEEWLTELSTDELRKLIVLGEN